MNGNQANDLSSFLQSVQKYVMGDIKEFKEHCSTIEANKNNGSKQSKQTQITSSFAETTTQAPVLLTQPTLPDRDQINNYSDRYKITIPITLAIFAVADMLGYLSRPEPDADEKDTRKNLKHFFNELVGFTSDQLDMFIDVIRHGMVHSYFPKFKMGIAYFTSDSEDQLIKKYNKENYYLNVKCLIIFFDKKFNSIIKQSENDQDMKNRFESLMSKYESTYEKFVRIFETR